MISTVEGKKGKERREGKREEKEGEREGVWLEDEIVEGVREHLGSVGVIASRQR